MVGYVRWRLVGGEMGGRIDWKSLEGGISFDPGTFCLSGNGIFHSEFKSYSSVCAMLVSSNVQREG